MNDKRFALWHIDRSPETVSLIPPPQYVGSKRRFRRWRFLTLGLLALAMVALSLFAGGPAPAQAQSAFTVTLTPSVQGLDVSWNAQTGAFTYTVFWKSGGQDYTAIGGDRTGVLFATSGTSYRITGLTAGTAYTVKVQAGPVNAVDSDEVTATPLPVGIALVSNTGLPVDVGGFIVGRKIAQGFVTGTNAGGYTLGSIGLDIASGRANQPTVELWSATVGGVPSARLATLTGPTLTTSSSGVQTYTAPAGTTLAASTRYFLLIDCSAPCMTSKAVSADGEDSGSASGWGIDNAYHWLQASNVWTTDGNGRSMRISVNAPGTNAVTLPEVPGLTVTSNAGGTALTVTWTAGTSTFADNDSVVFAKWKGPGQDYVEPGVFNSATRTAFRFHNTVNTFDIPDGGGALAPGTQYGVLVQVIPPGPGATVSHRSEVTVTTNAAIPAVTGLTATSNDAGDALTVSWSAYTGAATYTVEWKSGQQSYASTRSTTGITSTSTTISSLTAGTAYTVRVTALPMSGTALAQSETTGTPMVANPIPAIPSFVVRSNNAGNALIVRWNAVTGATAYTLQWKSGGQDYDTTRRALLNSAGSYTITGLTAGTVYTVRMQATTTAEPVAAQSEVTATPAVRVVPDVPGLSVTSNAAGNGLIVKWNAVRNASNYFVQWKSGGQNYDTTQQAQVASTVLTYTISNLAAGTAYTVRVQVRTGATVNASSEVTATPFQPNVLVSNVVGIADSGPFSADATKRAQGFVTGSITAGYTLTSIGVNITTASYTSTPTAELWSASGTSPSAKVADLTSPTLTSTSTGLQTFSAPANTSLTANTRYFLVLYCSSSACLAPARHAANAEDAGAEQGWSIDDAYHTQASQTVWTGDASGRSMRISVSGAAKTTLPAITGLAVNGTTASSTRLDVSWNAAAGATGYEIAWKETSAASYTNSTTTTTTTRNITGLTAGTEYTVRVRATGTGTVGPWVEGVGLPSIVAARLEVRGRTIIARWNNPPGTTLCENWLIHVSLSDTVGTECGQGKTYTGLSPGLSNTFRIRTYITGGHVEGKATAQATLDKVANLTATAGSKSLNLSWNALTKRNNDPDISYIVQWKTSGEQYSTTRQATATTNSYTIPSLSDETAYTVRVRGTMADRPAALGPWSDDASGTTLPPPPEIPGITWELLSATSIKVQWPKVAGATHYSAEWKVRDAADSTYAASSVVAPAGGNPATTTLTGLTAISDYTIRVEAAGRDSGNNLVTLARSVIDVTTTPEVPNVEVSVASATSLKVDWDAYTGGTVGRYIVTWETGPITEQSSHAELAATARTHTISGLTTDETYTVRVQAFTTVNSEGSVILGSLLAETDAVITLTDKPGFTVTPTEITIDEGDTTTYTIKLKKKPSRDVRILPTDRGSRFRVKPTSGEDWLTFTPTNWSTPQSVTLTAVEDLIPWRSADKVYAKWVVRGDKVYRELNFPPKVAITINDNDTAGVQVDLDPDTTGDQHELGNVEGGMRIYQKTHVQYRIRLTAQPYSLMHMYVYANWWPYSNGHCASQTGDVVGTAEEPSEEILGISIHPPSDLPGYDGYQITFNEYNWNQWKTVDVYVHPTEERGVAYICHWVPTIGGYNKRAQYAGVKVPAMKLYINQVIPEPEGNSGAQPPQDVSQPPNTAPSFDAGLATALTVAENSPAGTNVGAPVAASDPDEGDTLTYTLSGDDVASFSIGGSTGQIATIAGVTYDYERRSYLPEPAYSLTVEVSDGNGGTASVPVTVTLTDVNDDPGQNLPPAFHEGTSTTREVADGSPAGTNVGEPITAFDPNGDALSYVGFDGADGAAFDLDGDTGQLTIKDGVSYDKSSYTFMVIVMETDTDEGHLTGISVTVTFTEAEEEDGTDTTTVTTPDTSPTVADTSKFKTYYATVGEAFSLTLPAADADSGNGGPYTYSLLKRSDGTAFSANGLSFSATTRTLSGTPTAEATHELAYQIHDSDTNKAKTDAFVEETKLKVVVLPGGGAVGGTGGDEPANQAPTFSEGASASRSVDENSAAATNVGSAFTATDPDSGDTLTYSLTGTDAAAFTIGSSTGQIATKSGVIYNYEAKSSYSLAVNVSDGKGGTASIDVTVNLDDVAEAPTVADSSQFKNHAAKVGQAFSLTLPAADANSGDGGPYEYLLWHRGHGKNFSDHTINGLSFDASTRTLSGTPTATGVWQLSYVVHDKDSDRGAADRFRAKTNLQITVAP